MKPQKFTTCTHIQAVYGLNDRHIGLGPDTVIIVQGFELTAPEIRTAPDAIPLQKWTAYDADVMWRVEND